MKKTGELLKQNRVSGGLSISEVALATKINPKVLTAIESGDEGNLPAKTFLKGFVRSYALFLKMDVDVVMRSFIEETGGPVAPTAHEAYQKQDATSPPSRRTVTEESSAGLRTVAVVVIVVLIGLIIGVRELVDKYQRERVAASTPADVKVSPLDEVKPDAGGEAKAAPAVATDVTPAKAEVKPEPKVEAKAESKPEPKPLAKAEEQAAATIEVVESKRKAAKVEIKNPLDALAFEPMTPMATVLASPLVAIPRVIGVLPEPKHEPASTTAPSKEPVTETNDAPAKVETVAKVDVPAPTAKPEPTPAEAAPTPVAPAEDAPAPAAAAKTMPKNEIIIEALDKVDVKFELAGESKTVALGPNEVQVIRADGAVTMDFSDGGAVTLVHNGRVRGVPGKLGEPKQVKYP